MAVDLLPCIPPNNFNTIEQYSEIYMRKASSSWLDKLLPEIKFQ